VRQAFSTVISSACSSSRFSSIVVFPQHAVGGRASDPALRSAGQSSPVRAYINSRERTAIRARYAL
jgi:hypothetical protein